MFILFCLSQTLPVILRIKEYRNMFSVYVMPHGSKETELGMSGQFLRIYTPFGTLLIEVNQTNVEAYVTATGLEPTTT